MANKGRVVAKMNQVELLTINAVICIIKATMTLIFGGTMKFKNYLTATVTILLIMSSSSIAQVELPFDYFYGRWVDGHYITSSYAGTNSNMYHKRTNYSFTKNAFRINVNALGDHILWDKDDNILRTPIVDVLYRINDHWQLGLEDFSVYQFKQSIYPSIDVPRSYLREHSNKSISIKSIFTKNNILKVANRHAPFAYQNKKIFSRGNLIIENIIRLDDNNSSYDLISHGPYDSTSYGTTLRYSSIDEYNFYNFYNRLIYGLSDNMNIIADINLRLYNSNRDYFSTSYHFDNNIQENYLNLYETHTERSSASPFYRISLLSGMFSPLYVEASIRQTFEDKKEMYYRYSSTSNDELIITENIDNPKLQESSTGMNLNLTYISKGEFNQDIILNDYNNYYHKMLFHKQFLISLDSDYEDRGTSDYLENRDVRMVLRSSYGLLPKLNIGGSYFYIYRFQDYSRSRRSARYEIINYNFYLKYRSYEFNSSTSTNWDSDSKYDIRFGNVLKAEEYFINFVFYPQSYRGRSSTNSKLFGFDNLRKSGTSRLSLSVNIGLGKLTELTVSNNYIFRTNQDNYYDFSLSVLKRVYDKVQFSLSFAKDNYRDRIPYNSDIKISGSINILL